MITKFKLFENSEIKYINVAIDASASCLSLINNDIINMLDFGDYDKINLITFNETFNYKVVDHIDIKKIQYLYGINTRITPVIDFVVNNGLNKYKTFIISDFSINDKPDYNKLIDYELINILDLYERIEKYNL